MNCYRFRLSDCAKPLSHEELKKTRRQQADFMSQYRRREAWAIAGVVVGFFVMFISTLRLTMPLAESTWSLPDPWGAVVFCVGVILMACLTAAAAVLLLKLLDPTPMDPKEIPDPEDFELVGFTAEELKDLEVLPLMSPGYLYLHSLAELGRLPTVFEHDAIIDQAEQIRDGQADDTAKRETLEMLKNLRQSGLCRSS